MLPGCSCLVRCEPRLTRIVGGQELRAPRASRAASSSASRESATSGSVVEVGVCEGPDAAEEQRERLGRA